MEDVDIFILIVAIIGWATAIAITCQCYRWRKRHDEAIEMWIIESDSKDEQIFKLQEELKEKEEESN